MKAEEIDALKEHYTAMYDALDPNPGMHSAAICNAFPRLLAEREALLAAVKRAEAVIGGAWGGSEDCIAMGKAITLAESE